MHSKADFQTLLAGSIHSGRNMDFYGIDASTLRTKGAQCLAESFRVFDAKD
jgi:hypothetical protein